MCEFSLRRELDVLRRMNDSKGLEIQSLRRQASERRQDMMDMYELWQESCETLDVAQMDIDLLMMEFCPEDITPKQWKNWEAHQKLVKG